MVSQDVPGTTNTSAQRRERVSDRDPGRLQREVLSMALVWRRLDRHVTRTRRGATPSSSAGSAKGDICARDSLRDAFISVDVPFFRRDVEERFLDPLQDGAVHFAGRRDGTQTMQELDGATEKLLETVLLVTDQEPQVAVVIRSREDEHVTELPASH